MTASAKGASRRQVGLCWSASAVPVVNIDAKHPWKVNAVAAAMELTIIAHKEGFGVAPACNTAFPEAATSVSEREQGVLLLLHRDAGANGMARAEAFGWKRVAWHEPRMLSLQKA